MAVNIDTFACADNTLTEGETLSFSGSVSGGTPSGFDWANDGDVWSSQLPINYAFTLKSNGVSQDSKTGTTTTYNFSKTATLSDTGSWTLEATNAGATDVSDPIAVTVQSAVIPVQPISYFGRNQRIFGGCR